MKEFVIDINCDVGEGVGNEADLLPLISSCNISCGAHAGDEEIIRSTIKLAKLNNVKIGAHPSYPDRENFGRQVMAISHSDLQQSIQDQLQLFCGILGEENGILHHIKPHGALYNQISRDRALAKTFLEAVQDYKTEACIYVPYKSSIAEEALDRGFKIIYEAFGDRNYMPNLQLVPRSRPNAVIEDPEEVLKHVVQMISEKKVITINGRYCDLMADTICVHGDTATALKILMYLQQQLPKHNIQLQK